MDYVKWDKQESSSCVSGFTQPIDQGLIANMTEIHEIQLRESGVLP